jgi:glyoxylase-like metal-dependent hydrolase (beta-lactamase superfamily II)
MKKRRLLNEAEATGIVYNSEWKARIFGDGFCRDVLRLRVGRGKPGSAGIVTIPGGFMIIRRKSRTRIALLLGLALSIPGAMAPGQGIEETYDLSKIAAGPGWTVVNRGVTAFEEGGRKGARFDERPGQGLAWLEEVRFAEGTIEFEVRGKDVPQRSFVGIAFHGADNRTFEAVYFRPFNFKNADPARVVRAVQYVCDPDFSWPKLRQETPGRYESAVRPVPDPNGWFHARIIVASGRVRVYVDGDPEPCLDVEKLGNLNDGMVGLFAGNNSGGDFANLKIMPAGPPGAPAGAAPPSPLQGLLDAVRADDLAAIRAFVEKDPRTLDPKTETGQRILLEAVAAGRIKMVEYLISKGADVRRKTISGTTPLHVACARNAPLDIVRLLVENGAEVNAVAKYSGTPMDRALDHGNAPVIEYLRSKGARSTPLEFETHRIAENLHRLAFPWGMRNNIAVFSGPDGLLLIDSGFSLHAVEAIKAKIGGLARGDIKYLISTHLHGDHVMGNAIVPSEANIITARNISSPAFRSLITKMDRPLRGPRGRELQAPWTMHFNGEEIGIIHNPGLHSDDDLLIVFPRSKAVCMGDLLLAGSCPAVQDVGGYMDFLETVLDVFPEGTTFISGHGPDLDSAGLRKYRDDLASMIDVVRANFRAGKSAEDMLRDDVLKTYKAGYSFLDWIGPDSWLESICKELRSGPLKSG